MPIFSARNGHEPKLLIYFQERKIREKLLPNEGTMMVFSVEDLRILYFWEAEICPQTVDDFEIDIVNRQQTVDDLGEKIFKTMNALREELDDSTVANFATTASEGKKYNEDVVKLQFLKV